MADYKELLRRAVEALPENNGAARRAVYEKARAALVGQLRAIHPPLPARDITTHRLQLEDCIRQVEQEASEAVIAGMGASAGELPPPPVYFEPSNGPRMQSALAKPQLPAAKSPPAAMAKSDAKPKLVGGRDAPRPMPQGGTIEEIIAAANAESPIDAPAPKKARPGARPEAKPVAKPEPKPAARPAQMRLAPPAADEEQDETPAEDADVLPPKPAPKPTRPLPAIVARAEAAKTRSASTAFSVPGGDKPYDVARRGPTIEPRPSMMPTARSGQAAMARQPVVEPVAFLQEPKVVAAMSAVREVEVEPQPVDPQGAIDRAIATLDREARGETAPVVNGAANDTDEDVPNGKARGLGAMMPGRRNGARPQMALPPPARETRPGRRGATDRGVAEPSFPRARQERERGAGLGAVAIFLIVFAVLLAGAGGAGYWAVSAGYLDLSGMLNGGTAATNDAQPDPAAAAVAEVSEPATGPGNTAAPAETAAPLAELAPPEERLTPEITTAEVSPLAMTAEEDR